MEKKKIIIVDDRPLLRDAWTTLLEANGKWIVTKALPKVKLSMKLLQQDEPNIIFLEISIPLQDDIKIIKLIRRCAPLIKVIAVSLHVDHSFSNQIFNAGAQGFINPECNADELLMTVDLVSRGRTQACSKPKTESLESKVEVNQLGKLTKREVQIIQFLRKGLSSKEIARKLLIAPRTVDAHRYKILRKLNVKNSSALIQLFNEFGL